LIIFYATVTVTTFLISGFLTYFRPTRLSYYSSKLSIVWGKTSGKTIRLRWDFAGARFLPDLEKVSDSCRSRSRNPVLP